MARLMLKKRPHDKEMLGNNYFKSQDNSYFERKEGLMIGIGYLKKLLGLLTMFCFLIWMEMLSMFAL